MPWCVVVGVGASFNLLLGAGFMTFYVFFFVCGGGREREREKERERERERETAPGGVAGEAGVVQRVEADSVLPIHFATCVCV